MKDQLIKLGLTEGEARVYLALLRIGFSTVGPIIREARVSNSKIYSIIQRLVEKGLVSYVIKEKTRYFHAAKPTRLNDFLDKKEEEIQQNRSLLKELMPRLKESAMSLISQEAEIFVGIKGIKTAYELLLEKHDKKTPLLFFYIHEKEQFPRQNLFYIQAYHYYNKIGIKLRGISTVDYKKASYFEPPPPFMDLRFVDFPLPSMVDIYKDKVLFTSWKDKPLAYLVHSKEISGNFRKYFEAVWAMAVK